MPGPRWNDSEGARQGAAASQRHAEFSIWVPAFAGMSGFLGEEPPFVRPRRLGRDGLHTTITVNGAARSLDLDPRTTLLDALREHLKLTGAKKGCDHGQCGACTVLVNGVRINSCLSLAVMHDGDEVVSIEGVGAVEKLHPVQQAFLKWDAFQCGYCTPGQICSTLGMLAEIEAGVPSQETPPGGKPVLSDAELRERMSGNICRCSAYPQIVAAIRDAAEQMA